MYKYDFILSAFNKLYEQWIKNYLPAMVPVPSLLTLHALVKKSIPTSRMQNVESWLNKKNWVSSSSIIWS